jgi:hypothetical protein
VTKVATGSLARLERVPSAIPLLEEALSEDFDAFLLAHPAVERRGELAAEPGMLGDGQTIREAARAPFKQVDGLVDYLAVLERKRDFVQEAAQRDQLGRFALVKRRPERPNGLRQDDIRHQQ